MGGAAPPGGNRITFAFVRLPVALGSPVDRLGAIVETMGELKRSGRVAGSELLLRGLAALPDPLKDRAARAAASPRLYNLTISNVPGPRMPLYVAGARVRSIVPVIPIPDRHALAVGVLTYDGTAHFGLYADPDALPGADALAPLLEGAVAELELAAGGRLAATARSRRLSARQLPYPGSPAPATASTRRSR